MQDVTSWMQGLAAKSNFAPGNPAQATQMVQPRLAPSQQPGYKQNPGFSQIVNPAYQDALLGSGLTRFKRREGAPVINGISPYIGYGQKPAGAQAQEAKWASMIRPQKLAPYAIPPSDGG